MKKKILALVMTLFIFISLVPTAMAEGPNVLYVATTGDDTASGTIDAPLATMEGARQKVLELKAQGINVSEVIFRGGDYYQRMVRFTEQDSGTEENPIVYRAYDGEEVNIKGSVPLDISKATRVTDEAILARLYESVRNKVIAIDLKEQGISQADICDTSFTNSLYTLTSYGGYNSIYIDGVEGMLAQWPNGRQFTSWPKTLGPKTFCYEETNPERWTNAKDWWIGAYGTYDFSYITITPVNVDTTAKSIEVDSRSSHTFTNPWSRRWKAFNLLEEIDLPGEFFIDRDNMILYMYPPYTLANSTMELSVENSAIVRVQAASNITFKNLNFTQSRSKGVSTVNVKNIDFIGCEFTNIGEGALQITGDKAPITGANYWQVAYMKEDASYDMDVKECFFENIGGYAIKIIGGNADNLIPANDVIENNYISGCNQRYIVDSAVNISGVGVVVRNNFITHSTQHGVQIAGNDHLVEKNEIYDVLREVGDAGAIYQGRNQIQRGTVIDRNYVHQIWPADPRLVSGTVGIYMDDGQQGNYITNNFIIGTKIGYNSNYGAAMEVKNNIIVDANRPWSFHNAGGGYSTPTVDISCAGTIADSVDHIANKELYYEHYPLLKLWGETHINPKRLNFIEGNLMVDCGEPNVGSEDAEFANFTNNIQTTGKDMFVDPDNHDWRVKSDSEIAAKLPDILTDKNFDMKEIGIQTELTLNSETAPFRLLYPQNGSYVNTSGLELYWEEARGANEYRVEIAKDPEFKDVVYNDISRFNLLPMEGLERNTKYYWRVTAINSSMALGTEWAHDGAVYSFTTNLYEKISTEAFESAAKQVLVNKAMSNEGSEAGKYRVGTKAFIENYIERTRVLANLRLGKYTQGALDARTAVINNYLTNKSLINPGYVDLIDYAKASNWTSVMDVDSQSIVHAKDVDRTFGGSTALSHMSGSVIYCFDAELTLGGDKTSFVGIGLNKLNSTYQYSSGNNGYYLIIKENVVELQRNGDGIIQDMKDIYLCDGKKHSLQFGIINTTIGCNIVFAVDGKMIFDYLDVSEKAFITDALEFTTNSITAGDILKFTRSENIPTDEDFKKHLKNAEYKSAEAILLSIPEVVNTKIVKSGTGKVLTEDGVIDSSSAAPEFKGEEMMVPAEVYAKMYGQTATISGNTATLNVKGTTLTFTENGSTYTVDGTAVPSKYPAYMKNGKLMIAVSDAASATGSLWTRDEFNGIMTITDSGAPHTVNQAKELRKVSQILDKLMSYGDTNDVYFKDLK